ncbi:MAG: hypothetical protein II236_02445 [Alistipes sp.]|nr:hypothetical protein [Alistipes sp.]
MGFRLIRIGNKVSVGEVSRFSFRHTTRSSSIIFYVVALFAVLVVVKCLGYDVPDWLTIVVSTLIAFCVGLADKQLPHRRWRTLSILLLLMAATFLGFGIYRIAIKQLPMGNDAWILGIMLIISLGYGIYVFWRLHRQVLWYRDLRLQRELRARRRRKTEY